MHFFVCIGVHRERNSNAYLFESSAPYNCDETKILHIAREQSGRYWFIDVIHDIQIVRDG